MADGRSLEEVAPKLVHLGVVLTECRRMLGDLASSKQDHRSKASLQKLVTLTEFANTQFGFRSSTRIQTMLANATKLRKKYVEEPPE